MGCSAARTPRSPTASRSGPTRRPRCRSSRTPCCRWCRRPPASSTTATSGMCPRPTPACTTPPPATSRSCCSPGPRRRHPAVAGARRGRDAVAIRRSRVPRARATTSCSPRSAPPPSPSASSRVRAGLRHKLPRPGAGADVHDALSVGRRARRRSRSAIVTSAGNVTRSRVQRCRSPATSCSAEPSGIANRPSITKQPRPTTPATATYDAQAAPPRIGGESARQHDAARARCTRRT